MPEDVVLRPAVAEDAAWLLDLVRLDAVASSLSTTAEDALEDPTDVWVAESPAGERVGAVRVVTVNRRSRIADVRALMVHPAARGRRLGVAILRAVARDAFARGVHRLEGEVYGFNEPALRTFDAAGFAREGVRRCAYDRHGAWQDGIQFGLLADD
jgi:RimJ/RimL family protein N-acetyltransferase